MDEGTRLWLPPLALAGCLRAAMLRDTRGRVLDGAAQETYFPAAPLVNLSFWFVGDGRWLASPGFSTPGTDSVNLPVMLAGPFTAPTHTCDDGPVHALMLLFLPDAFRALTGIDPGALVNHVVDARRHLPADWLAWALGLPHLPDDDARLASIEAFLQPRWQARGAERGAFRRYTEWAEAMAVRATVSATGRSLRQIERRVKAWAGLPMRELRAVSRGERAFLAVAASQAGEPVDWAALAAEHDYADQSHLCRETRRLTGFSPDDLHRRILGEEAFWPYRLWQ